MAQGSHYFLSRPRCFGKSLLIDTLAELFAGHRALQQLIDRGHADKYRARREPIHLIGVEFSNDQRSVVGFAVKRS